MERLRFGVARLGRDFSIREQYIIGPQMDIKISLALRVILTCRNSPFHVLPTPIRYAFKISRPTHSIPRSLKMHFKSIALAVTGSIIMHKVGASFILDMVVK